MHTKPGLMLAGLTLNAPSTWNRSHLQESPSGSQAVTQGTQVTLCLPWSVSCSLCGNRWPFETAQFTLGTQGSHSFWKCIALVGPFAGWVAKAAPAQVPSPAQCPSCRGVGRGHSGRKRGDTAPHTRLKALGRAGNRAHRCCPRADSWTWPPQNTALGARV